METRTLNVLFVTGDRQSDSTVVTPAGSLDWFELNIQASITADQLLDELLNNCNEPDCGGDADIFVLDVTVSTKNCRAILERKEDCTDFGKKPLLIKGSSRRQIKPDVIESLDRVFYVGDSINGGDVRRAMMSYEDFWFVNAN